MSAVLVTRLDSVKLQPKQNVLDLLICLGGLSGYRRQVAFQQVPNINDGCGIQNKKDGRPGQSPLEGDYWLPHRAVVPLDERKLGSHLVQSYAPV